MKFVTFRSTVGEDRYRVGVVVSETEIIDVTSATGNTDLDETSVLGFFDLEKPFLQLAREIVRNPEAEQKLDRGDIKLVSPVPRPGKIICIGLNYRDHAEESGMAIPKSPVIFSKFSTCMIGPTDAIVIPAGSSQLDYEAELAFVIG